MADIGYWIPFFKRAYFEQDVLDIDWSHLWSPLSFQFQHGKTPFTHIGFVFATLLAYILFSFALQAWMKNRTPFKLTGFVVFHNALLCLWSLAMAIGIGAGAYEAYRYYGSFLSTLSDEKRFISNTPSLGLPYWTYIFYLSKFYEVFFSFPRLHVFLPKFFVQVPLSMSYSSESSSSFLPIFPSLSLLSLDDRYLHHGPQEETPDLPSDVPPFCDCACCMELDGGCHAWHVVGRSLSFCVSLSLCLSLASLDIELSVPAP